MVTEWLPNGVVIGRALDVALSLAGKIIPVLKKISHLQVDEKHRVEIEGIFVRITRNHKKAVRVTVIWSDNVAVSFFVKGVILSLRAYGPVSAQINVDGGEIRTSDDKDENYASG
jgi:hypothetical protein